MNITFNFIDGDTPDIGKGQLKYYLVRALSPHDKKVRVFGAMYLNEHPLDYEWGCNGCEGKGDDCPMANGDGCPTTGWFNEALNNNDEVYDRIYGRVLGFAELPAPLPIQEARPND